MQTRTSPAARVGVALFLSVNLIAAADPAPTEVKVTSTPKTTPASTVSAGCSDLKLDGF